MAYRLDRKNTFGDLVGPQSLMVDMLSAFKLQKVEPKPVCCVDVD